MRTQHSIGSTGSAGRRRRIAQRGQVLIMFATMTVILIGMVGLSVDAGFLMSERRQAQSAADAGALAAAKAKLDRSGQPDSETIQINTGKQYGALNAETAQSNVNVDPNPAEYGSDFVQVTVAKDVQPFFLRAVYAGSWNVTAAAVAGTIPIAQPYALLSLGCGPSGTAGIYINGSGTVDVHEGSIMSNCRIDRSGDSSTVTAGGSIDANGSINAGSLWSAGDGYNQRPALDDPIVAAGIQPPSRSAAQAVRNVTTGEALKTAVDNLNSSNRCPNGVVCRMRPGYYGGSLTLEVQGTLRLDPGIYYFGDSFNLKGMSAGSRIEGTDVLLYFTDSASFTPANAFIQLSAAPSSLYAGGLDGMLLWIANCTPFQMQSNGSFVLAGVVYAPCSQVRLFGSPGSNGMQVVVGSLELSGGGSFDILFTDYIRADVPRVFLVE